MQKPLYGTPGQPTKQSTGAGGANKRAGGTIGQDYGSRNKSCKPRFGAKGQRLSGGGKGARSGGHNAKRGGNDRSGY